MSFIQLRQLTNSFNVIIDYINNISLSYSEGKDITENCNKIYCAAFAIRICIDDYIANNCYLAIPELLIDINEGFLKKSTLTIPECTNFVKTRLLALVKDHPLIYRNVNDILSKGPFYRYYGTELISLLANESINKILIT